jgi:psp operon transcriptional activator
MKSSEIDDANNQRSVIGVSEALGQSERFLMFQERLSQVARINRPVLIIGERGTGKELAASRLHYLSRRWEGPLVALNCASLAPTLIESELFGHERGAFTGAAERRQGRFELAHQGTLFLDELGNIPLEAQEKILRVVEYGMFERVGGTTQVQVDARIIGATNADLMELAKEGRFKEDLLDRLSFEVLHLPPLRERQDDIMLLAGHFASRMAFEQGKAEVPEFSEEAAGALESYPWPGNIRELKNVVERAVYRTEGDLIEEIVFDPFLQSGWTPIKTVNIETKVSESKTKDIAEGTFDERVAALEIELLESALRQCRFNQRRAAQRLQLTYNQFRGLYRKYKDRLKMA